MYRACDEAPTGGFDVLAGGSGRPDVSKLYVEGLDAVMSIMLSCGAHDWNRTTPCDGWLVRDLARHLHGVALDSNTVLADALAHQPGELMTAHELDNFNRRMLRTLPVTTPLDDLSSLRRAALRLIERSRGHEDLPCYTYQGQVWSVSDFVGILSIEWHVHAWDVAVAIGGWYEPTAPYDLARAFRAGTAYLAPPVGDSWEEILAATGREVPPTRPDRKSPVG